MVSSRIDYLPFKACWLRVIVWVLISEPKVRILEVEHDGLIQLYSFDGDVVLDPFMGSGTTATVALRSGRYFVR